MPKRSTRRSRRVHSASSVKLAMQCRHAWALCYIDGYRKPDVTWAEIVKAEAKIARGKLRYDQHPCYGAPGLKGAALGTEVHTRAEVYLTYGHEGIVWDDLPGQVLRELIDHLPPPGSVPSTHVEHEFEVELCGVLWKGLIDIYGYDLEGIPHGVWDHKTTRDLLMYALLPDAAAKELAREFPAPELNFAARSIRDDIQSCVYVLYTAVRRALRPGQQVPVRWNYSETQRVRRSLRVVDNIECTHALKVVKAAAEIAQECDTYESSSEAPCNTLSCDDYGGCWYRGRHCTAKRDYGALIAHRKIKAHISAE